jgi:hypothetical protein
MIGGGKVTGDFVSSVEVGVPAFEADQASMGNDDTFRCSRRTRRENHIRGVVGYDPGGGGRTVGGLNSFDALGPDDPNRNPASVDVGSGGGVG